MSAAHTCLDVMRVCVDSSSSSAFLFLFFAFAAGIKHRWINGIAVPGWIHLVLSPTKTSACSSAMTITLSTFPLYLFGCWCLFLLEVLRYVLRKCFWYSVQRREMLSSPSNVRSWLFWDVLGLNRIDMSHRHSLLIWFKKKWHFIEKDRPDCREAFGFGLLQKLLVFVDLLI